MVLSVLDYFFTHSLSKLINYSNCYLFTSGKSYGSILYPNSKFLINYISYLYNGLMLLVKLLLS